MQDKPSHVGGSASCDLPPDELWEKDAGAEEEEGRAGRREARKKCTYMPRKGRREGMREGVCAEKERGTVGRVLTLRKRGETSLW